MLSTNEAKMWAGMEATEIAAYAGLTAAALAIIGLAVRAIYSMGELSRDVQALRETVGIELQAHREAQSLELQAHKEAQSLELQAHKEAQSLELQGLRDAVGYELRALEQRMNQNHEILRSDIRRLFDAMVSHYHDTDGNVVFRVPPAGAFAEPEESPAD